ncbi:phospholipid carrier-dependent glycosyltransferase [Candidatus Daviesbacteria bacterium]|nr:phospholipid carrier-dependent glycosyltransferase [Candidatus Daviesbacteria bacterium]
MFRRKFLTTNTLLILVIIITLFFRLYRLDYPSKYMFDEVYHAFTAKEYLKGSKAAWEWWSVPPLGVAYEWTHPPLAKEIMALSMYTLHSTDSWAWRLPGALLGTFSVYLVYILAKHLFNKQVGLISAFIFSFDGLNFVQSRIGMNDIYFVTFMLISLYFFLNKKFFLSALIISFSISSKWSGIYILLIYLPLLLAWRNYSKIIYFILLLPLIYLISYIPFFTSGHSAEQFIELQRQMWLYHTNLKAAHPYSSPWWSWPLNLYPVWYFVDYQGKNIATIFAFGNSVVFWAGSAAIFLTIWEAVKKQSCNLFLICLGFLVFWLPWAFSPRIMFLYHFSPSVPFLSIALGYQLYQISKDKQLIPVVICVLFSIFIVFLIIFPFLTGIPVPKPLINWYFLTNLAKNPF